MNRSNASSKNEENSNSTTSEKITSDFWGGRFTEATDAFVQRFTASYAFDRKLVADDIQGSLVHAAMLAKVGVLSEEELKAIENGLAQIVEEIQNDQFDWRVEREDVHMNIEARLTEIIGETGKKLHTGRSRNDQVATDIRLWLRRAIDTVTVELTRLQRGIVMLARDNSGTIFPGFTHLQVAQPVTFGHHLLAWNEMLERDWGRFRDCRTRMNRCPLGAAALAGTTFPIDRDMTAVKLGFDGPTLNSLDSVADRDFAIEFSAAAALLMTHLSRMSEEMIIWASAQFDFVDIPDRFCTGSSIMPQKKNPDVPELVRGKTGRVNGHLINLLTLMKSQPLAYNKDNQEDKEPLFDSVQTVVDCLRAFADMIPALKPKVDNMRRAALTGFATATDLADYLVRRGLPFRDAHEVVGNVVAHCVTEKCNLEELKLATLQTFNSAIENDVFDVLTLEGSVAARDHIGGTAPVQVLMAAKVAAERLNQRSS